MRPKQTSLTRAAVQARNTISKKRYTSENFHSETSRFDS